jgi:HEPN superfamily AbiU2-like protein
MPGQVGPVFCELRHTVLYLNSVHQLWFDLFWDDEAEGLLHYVSPYFANVVRESMLRDLLMTVARLTDPPSTGGPGKENLSFARLLHEITSAGDQLLVDRLRPKVQGIEGKAADIRFIRRKVLAHADLALAIAPAPPPLPETTREAYEELVAEMVDSLNNVQIHYLQSATDYTGDAASHATQLVVHALRQFREVAEARRR